MGRQCSVESLPLPAWRLPLLVCVVNWQLRASVLFRGGGVHGPGRRPQEVGGSDGDAPKKLHPVDRRASLLWRGSRPLKNVLFPGNNVAKPAIIARSGLS